MNKQGEYVWWVPLLNILNTQEWEYLENVIDRPRKERN